MSAARARHERNRNAIRRIKQALDSTQKDMTAIRGTVGTGRKDAKKSVAKLLRDARRDVEKMNKAVMADLERMQKELTAAAKARPAKRKTASARKTRTGTARKTRATPARKTRTAATPRRSTSAGRRTRVG
jgi:hypothetical protein